MNATAGTRDARRVWPSRRVWVSALLGLLLASSVLQACSALSLTTRTGFQVGVAPYWLIGAVVLLAVLISLRGLAHAMTTELPGDARRAAICLGGLAAYGIVSAFTLPFVFQGIQVLSPRVGMDLQYMAPSTLQWSLSNAGQAGYMLINFSVFLFLALGTNGTKAVGFLHSMLVGTGLAVVAFALLQHISVAYLPNSTYELLYRILHNNPIYQSYPVSTFRTNSFFLEPSFFAGFSAVLVCMLIFRYLYSGRRIALILAVVTFYALLTSLAITGFSAFVAGLALTLLVLGIRMLRSHAAPPERQAVKRLLICLVLLAGTFFAFRQEQILSGRMALVRQQTINKQRSTSARNRLWADQFSVQVIPRETDYLGAGLGSSRPSSFVAYLASNLGVPGLVAFLGFLVFAGRAFLRSMHLLSPTVLAIGVGFFTYITAVILSLPDPSWPPFLWILAGMTLAGLGAERGGSALSESLAAA